MSQVLAPGIASARTACSAWRIALPVLLLVLAGLLWTYRETGLAMVGIWHRSETFTHAFIVPPISLWLIWRRRGLLAQVAPSPSWWFALPLALAAAAWLLGQLVAVNALAQFALVAMLVATVPLLLGSQVARLLAFPLGFLFFAVPVGEFLMPVLMESTADFTVAALRLTGIPVYREGQQFVIPSGNWSVVEACSGLRYLIASVMVGTLFAYLNYATLRRRLVFIAFATLLPLVANWLRAYMIVMIGHLSGNRLAVGADHLVYGWVFFGVIMMAMFMIGARWADASVSDEGLPNTAMTTAQDRPVWPAALLALALLALPVVVENRLGAVQAGSRAVDVQIGDLPNWQREPAAPSGWRPVFSNPAAEIHSGYSQGSAPVGLHVAYYRLQGYDSKLISSSNVLVQSDDKQWTHVASETSAVEFGGRQLLVRASELRGSATPGVSGERLRVWQFYWVGGQLTISPVEAKLYGAWHELSGHGYDAAYVIVYTRKEADNGADADRLLARFMRDNWESIAAALARAQARR